MLFSQRAFGVFPFHQSRCNFFLQIPRGFTMPSKVQVSWLDTLISQPPAAGTTHCPCSSSQQVTSWDGGQAHSSKIRAFKTLSSPPLLSLERRAAHLGMSTRSPGPAARFYGGGLVAGPLLGRKGLLITGLCLHSISEPGAYLHRKQHARNNADLRGSYSN